MAETDHCDLWLGSERVIFRVAGPGSMEQAPAMRETANLALEAGVDAIYVDLRECTYMDSTFIGTLVHIWKQAAAAADVSFTIVGPSEACHGLLRGMGLDKLLPACDAFDDPDVGWVTIQGESDRASPAFRQSLVSAHHELAQLPGPTGQIFRRVAEQMRKEYGEDGEETIA